MGRNIGRFLNEWYRRGAKQARYRENGVWYHLLERFPGDLYDGQGVVRFETESDYRKFIRIGPDPNHAHADLFGKGIRAIPGYERLNPPPRRII
jgi:hypothetical protein